MTELEKDPLYLDHDVAGEVVIVGEDDGQLNNDERRRKWTLEETIFFLETLQRFQLHSKTHPELPDYFWDDVIDAMNIYDKKRAYIYKQCHKKYCELKRIYQSIIESGTSSRVQWPYFKLISILLSEESENNSLGGATIHGKFHWSHAAIVMLLAELKRQVAVYGKCPSKWTEVVKALQQKGFTVSISQCLNKVSGLKRTYNNLLKFNERHKWPFFNMMAQLLNEGKSSNNPDQNDGKPPAISAEGSTSPLWSYEAIAAMIEELKTLDFLVASNDETLWKRVSQRLTDLGYNVNSMQCYGLFSSLKTTYQSYANVPGEIRSQWKFYAMLNELFESGKYSWKSSSGSQPIKNIASGPSLSKRWSDKAMKIFLDVVKSAVLPEGPGFNSSLWERVSQKLASSQIKFTPMECQGKWKQLDENNSRVVAKLDKPTQHFEVVQEIIHLKDLKEKKAIEDPLAVEQEIEVLTEEIQFHTADVEIETGESDIEMVEQIIETEVETTEAERQTKIKEKKGFQNKKKVSDKEVDLEELFGNDQNAWPSDSVTQLTGSVICRCCLSICKQPSQEMQSITEALLQEFTEIQADVDAILPLIACEHCYGVAIALYRFKLRVRRANETLSAIIEQVCGDMDNTEKMKLFDNSDKFVIIVGDDNKETETAEGDERDRRKTRWRPNVQKRRPYSFLPCSEGCGKKFSNNRQLQAHLRIHKMCIHKCAICNEAFSKQESLVMHCQLYHRDIEVQLRCRYCNVQLSEDDQGHKHYELWHGETGLITATVALRSDASSEVALQHKLNIENEVEQNHLCDFCGDIFLNVQEYSQHVTNLTCQRFECNDCGKSDFKTKDDLSAHLKMAHKILLESDFKHQCEHCGKSYPTRSTLQVHYASHGQQLCGICGRKVASGPSFRRHMRRHAYLSRTKLKSRHPCSQCDKVFMNRQALFEHVARCHEKVRKFKCQKCDKAFWSACNLKEHEQRHLGRRMYSCKVCEMNLVSMRALLLHERAVHTLYKPYHCPVEGCGQRFVSTNRKNVHVKLKHLAPDIECPMCGKMFHYRARLQTHIQLAHGQAKSNE